MTLQINNGYEWIDITDFVAYQGLKWQRNDIDGPNAGRNMAGTMIRDRVATKIRLDITCRPLYLNELRTLLNLIQPVTISVRYDDPMMGMREATMYSNNNPAGYCQKYPNGLEYWHGITFPLIEV